MTKTKSRFFTISFWRNVVLGAGLLSLFGSGIFTFTMAQTNGYYIIDSTDSRYPQGCNTPGLSNPNTHCLLKIPVNGGKSILIAPASTEVVRNLADGYNYCRNLNIAGLSWRRHGWTWGDNERGHMVANKAKIGNQLSAAGSQKPGHYWGWDTTAYYFNCSNNGACWRESPSYLLSNRCVTTTTTLQPEGERCFDFSAGTITNYKKGAYPECGASVTIPATIGGQAVTAIGDRAFHNKGLTSVTFPDSVTTIGENAFSINQITSLTIPNSVTTIKNVAFTRNHLTTLVIPASVTNLGTFAFDQNRLTSLSLPDGMMSIPLAAFRHNQLTSVKIPSSVTRIDQHAFSYNPWKPALGNKVEGKIKKDPSTVTVDTTANIQLIYDDGSTPASCFGFSNGTITSYNPAPADCGKDVVIPKTINGQAVTAIGMSAFAGKGLTSLQLPDGLQSIGNQAFISNSLTSVVIPDSVTTIAEHAFRLNQLTSVTLGNGLKEIKLWAFENNKITSLTVPDSVTTIGDTAFARNQISSLHIGSGVTTIGMSAFTTNPMTSLTLGKSVQVIGNYAFENNKLTTVQLPSTLTSIGAYSFFGCPGKPELSNKVEGMIRKDPSTVSVGAHANIQLVYDDGTTPARCFGFSNGTITSYNHTISGCGKDVVIPSRINGQAVVRIGDDAFKNKGLTSVDMPNGIVGIGMNAFRENNLQSLVLPNTVTSVKYGAFALNALTSVNFSSSLATLENRVFANNQFVSILIPNTIIRIDEYAFLSNPWKPELGNKVEGIIKKDPSTVTVAANANIELIYNNDTPEHCFHFSNGKILKYKKDSAPECSADVVIPRQIGSVNVLAIGQKAFDNMGITSVKIPSTVQLIDHQAFINNHLTTLEIPNSVREIGLQAFAYNKISSISGDVTNHATHVKIGPAAFNDNHLPDDQAFFYSRYVPLANLTHYTHYWWLVSYGGLKKDNVKVPTKTSQVIAMYAFFKTNVNSVLLPEWVKILGRKTFASNNLTKVVLPESLTHIYPEAFVNNPGKVEYAGKVEGLVSVDPDTIMNMTGSNIELVWLHTPAACFDFTNGTITNYKKGFLPACGDEVKIPKQISGSNVTRIGAQAFLSKRITSVVFPDTLVEIGNEAFKANRLTGVVLPNTLIKISDFAFVQNFWKPELGNKVEGRIKKDPDTVAVADNANIELVRQYTPTISSCFEVQSGVILDYKKGSSPECGADVVIPSQISGVVITQIGLNAFSSKGLHSVIFPSTLVRIQASAFSGNQLSSVELPNSVVQIDAQAFSANMKNPVWAFRNAGLTGLSLAPNANLLINPLFLDVAYENLDGETLLATGTFVGSGKSDFTWWGPATASQWFQPGQTHKVIPPVLTGYLAPAEKEVRFPTRLTRKNNRMSIKLIYQFKPELILHYTFDQASNLGKDSSVRANHGSHTNMTSLTGRVERSVFVKGGTKLTSKRPVYVDGAKAFTVAYRVKPEQLAPNTRSLIDASAGNQGFRFGLQQDGRVHFFIGNGAHTATMACGTESLPMHRWSHVAGVFNMLSGSFDCYLDGKQIGTVSLWAFTGMIAQPLVLGKHSNDYQLQFDELKVWNYALTPQKLKAEYDQGNTPMVTITYLNEWDEAIKGQAQTVIKITSSGQLFQMDTNYTIKAPNLHDTQAIDPKQQTVRFSINQNNALELTFKYKEHYCRRFEGQYKVSKAECKALSDFYTATQGHAWTNNQGWNQMGQKNYVELCTWKGVNCTATKVTALQLPNNNLNGSLPNTFKQLNHLERLDLSRNVSLRNVLIQLHHPHLKELNLNGSQLNEAFPVNFFQRNSKLEKVFLTDSALHGTLPRLALTLKELMLNKNRLTGKIPSSLAQLQHLEKLNLEDNLLVEQLPDALRAARFPHLKAFSLAKNYIAWLSTSHVYRGLQSKNKKLNKPADQDPNLLQQKILFWSDNKGVELKKLDQLSSGQVVTVKIIRQVWKQWKWALGESLAASELVILNQNNITLVEERSPEYRIKLTNPDHDGFFILGVRWADHTGEWTKAQITLSTHDLPDEEINKPGDWSITGGIQSSELDKGGLHFELGGKYLDEFFSAVHFNVAGNDFWGGFFWLPVEKLPEPIVIETKAQGGTTQIRKCHNKVRGFYYNSQRGERLWPLDPQSQQALRKFSPETYGNDLDFKGGWYTSCEGVNENCTSWTCVEDPFGIYGAIIHTYKGEAFHLNAGIAYNTDQNRMKSDGLRCNFQRLNNSYYFWYIYDDRGHIGFVGAKIKTGAMLNSNQVAGFHGELNQLLDQGLCMSQIFDYDGKKLGYNKDNKIPGFPDGQSIHDFLDLNPGSAKTTLFNLGIKGIIGLTTEINNEEKKFFEGNTQESTLLLRTDATISKVVNTASKHAEALCRGKWQQGTLSLSPQVICINDETSLLRSGISAHDLAGKTVVVKDQNLVFSALMDTDDKPINLFIDRGNLMLPAVLHTGTLSAFDAHGYPDTSADPKVSKAGFLRGNFIINGLLLWGEEGNDVIENKLYIHGKLVSFNTFKQPTEERVRTVKNLLEAAATWNELYKGKIAMDEVFAWRCDLNIGTDGTRCQGLSKQEREQQGKLSSLLVDKAFGLIDMDFASPFFD